jgi:hypothetical protein
MTRQWILDTGKTQNWAGATPLRRLSATKVVGSLQPSQEVEKALSDGVLPVSSYATQREEKGRRTHVDH